MLMFEVSGGLHFISSTTRGKALASLDARSIDNLFITFFSSFSSKLKLGKKIETPGGRDTLLNFVDGRQIGKLGTRIWSYLYSKLLISAVNAKILFSKHVLVKPVVAFSSLRESVILSAL
jgi:hypothetical protein